MGRSLRPHCPGVVFHVTSRLQGRAAHLVGLEGRVAALICEVVERSDARVLAYTIMPNHIHVVLQQGALPLGKYMQPLLRRVALLLQRERGCEGHVVERRYREHACLTPDYMRNAIAYVHLNAIRAGLCENVDDYPWCSHTVLSKAAAIHPRCQSATEDALRLYAMRFGDPLFACGINYRRFVEWRLRMDQWINQDGRYSSFHAPNPPSVDGGDEHWRGAYAPFLQFDAESRRGAPPRMDLRDVARAVLRQVAPNMHIDDVRAGGSSRVEVAARRAIIKRAGAVGYTGKAIAHYLRISPASVSVALKSS